LTTFQIASKNFAFSFWYCGSRRVEHVADLAEHIVDVGLDIVIGAIEAAVVLLVRVLSPFAGHVPPGKQRHPPG